jgi:hypothetical protein
MRSHQYVKGVIAFPAIDLPVMDICTNWRGIISGFFKYAIYRGWITEKPLSTAPVHRFVN